MARIKPGSLGSLVPLWTQAQPSTSRAPRQKKRSTLPEDILAWLRVTDALVGKQGLITGEGLVGSAAGAIQQSVREGRLKDLREEQLASQEAAEHRRRRAAAHAEAGADEYQSQLMHERAAQMMGTASDQQWARAAGLPPEGELYPSEAQELQAYNEELNLQRAAPAAPAAPPVAAPAPAATTTPGFKVGNVQVPGRPVMPLHEEIIGDIREREGAAGPAPTEVFTFAELMGSAYDARSGAEYQAIVERLPDVMDTDPAMGGRSLQTIIFGTAPEKRIKAQEQLMESFLEGQKHRRISDENLAFQRRVKGITDLGRFGHELSDIESKIQHRAELAKLARSQRKGRFRGIAKIDRALLVKFSDSLAGNAVAGLDGKTLGQKRTWVLSKMGNDTSPSLMNASMTQISRDESEKVLTAIQRTSLADIRRQQARLSTEIEKIRGTYGTIKDIVNAEQTKLNLEAAIQNFVQLEDKYRAAAELYGVKPGEIQDLSTIYEDDAKTLGLIIKRLKKAKQEDETTEEEFE